MSNKDAEYTRLKIKKAGGCYRHSIANLSHPMSMGILVFNMVGFGGTGTIISAIGNKDQYENDKFSGCALLVGFF